MYNNKILKEWNKIKDCNIFGNIEEFAKLFECNPNGSCYKKYSNYDWCKENFFFGEYKDLLEFYKTSTEIPFYLNNVIGKKYGQLTIKEFNVQLKNNKRVYYATCTCDCGRECIKEYTRIIEGHISTCGHHKQQHKNDLYSNYPDIISQYWDYDKNKELPENISINSEQLYWWKDETGNFQLKPTELTRKQFGTSFHEQAILYYCKQIFNNVKNRFRKKVENSNIEMDIFLPDLNLAIEYDGVFWHKNKENFDLEKTNKLNQENIYLIRVREKGLQIISNNLTKTIICNFNDCEFEQTLNSIFLEIKNIIKTNQITITDLEQQKLYHFSITKEKFEDEKINIINQYRINYVSDNITKTCLMRLWDYNKNKGIIPQKISIKDDVKIWFTCKYGFSRKISVKSIADKHLIFCKEPTNCKNCTSIYCPLVNYCNRWYRGTNPCTQTMKYYFYRVINKNELHDKKDSLLYYNQDVHESYINKHLEINNDDFYNTHSIFKYYKTNNMTIPEKLFYVFRQSEISMQEFETFEEFEEFMNIWKPYIINIKFIDFDKEDLRDKFLKYFLDYMLEHKYYMNLLKLNLDDKDNVISKPMVLGLIKILKKLFTNKKNPEYLFLLNNYITYMEKNKL